MTKDQRPPKGLWHSPKKCEDWIETHKPGEKDAGKTGMLEIEDFERE